MHRFYKRNSLAILLALILIFITGCTPAIPDLNDTQSSPSFQGLHVSFLDVGQGDCVVITFPDKKIMMIDCGNGSSSSVNTVQTYLQANEISVIDYLVLTHPDVDHVGKADKALKNVSVKKVYHPDIAKNLTGFESYYSALDFLERKGASFAVSERGECLGDEYKLAILAPTSKSSQNSSYRDFMWATHPTDTQINDLSPYIYLEYKGVRFLFTGDCSSVQEIKLLNDYYSDVLNRTFVKNNLTINLANIDFLKVSHHGSELSSTKDFVDLLKAKHAVFSVGGDNSYGHPSTAVQQSLITANPKVKILRTDVMGTISVKVDTVGQVKIEK